MRVRATLLGEKGFTVQFFNNIDSFQSALERQRVGVIVVSDDGNETVTERMLRILISIPDIQAAKLVMVRNTHSDRLNFLAAAANFRDIIPADVDEAMWVTRFLYATSPRALPYSQPIGQISVQSQAALALPCRITWASETLLRIECRMSAPVGSELALRGPIAEALGMSSIPVKVKETQKSHLLFRFSDALIVEWTNAPGIKERSETVVAAIKQTDPGHRVRIFVAVKSARIRQDIITRFSDPRFEITTALQKNSILHEPKYLTPDLVFFEEALLEHDDGELFMGMLAALPKEAVIVIVGRESGNIGVAPKAGERKVIQIPKIPTNLSTSVLAEFIPKEESFASHLQREGWNVAGSHSYSHGEIVCPAKLTGIHPLSAQVTVPYPVGNFALARLDAAPVTKVIGRKPFIKLTSVYENRHPSAGVYTKICDAYLAHLDSEEQKAFARNLSSMVTDTFNALDPAGIFRLAKKPAAVAPPPQPIVQEIEKKEIPLDPKILEERRKKRIKSAKEIVFAIALVALVAGAMFGFFFALDGRIERSGKTYSEQLEIFSNPSRKEK